MNAEDQAPNQEQVTMKNSNKTAGIRVKSSVKAGGFGGSNHNVRPL